MKGGTKRDPTGRAALPAISTFIISGTALCSLALLGGCASYWKDRGRDLADPFGVKFFHTGIGASVRATHFLQAGYCGLLGAEGHNLSMLGREVQEMGPPSEAFEAGLAPLAHWRSADGQERGILLGRSFLSRKSAGESKADGPARQWNFLPPPRLYREGYDRRLFDFGVSVYPLLGFDLSFNPVQAVDFLLGFTTLDIAGDDVGNGEEEEVSPSASQAGLTPTARLP